MPAIDHTNDLSAPGPVAAWMDLSIHGSLHLVQVVQLVVQRTIISADNLGIECAHNDGSIRLHCVDGTHAHVEEASKICRGNISGQSILLHLFIATLYRVGSALRDIGKKLRVKQARAGTGGLAHYQQNMQTQVVIVIHSRAQLLTGQIAKAASWIIQAYPVNTREILSWTGIDSQHTGRIDLGKRCWRRRACDRGLSRCRGRASWYYRRGKLIFRCTGLPGGNG